MEDTKQKILLAAAKLFEQQGYRKVSMRAIAAELGISVGNLTYHFPHKQDLASALAEREMVEILPPEQASLAALDGYLRRMIVSLVDHARMFDDPLLFEDMPERQQDNVDRIAQLRRGLEHLLGRLTEQGIFFPSVSGQLQQDLVDLLMFSHVGWQRRTSTAGQTTQVGVDDMMRLQWLVLRPYLTETGTQQLAELFAK